MTQQKPMLSKSEALERLLSGVNPIRETEVVPTQKANNRVLAKAIVSGINVPALDNSSMDGYAVRVEDCRSGHAVLKVTQRIPAGHVGTKLSSGEAARIFTGAPVPEGADAIVMQEMCVADGDEVTIQAVPQSGEWIRRAGEDIKKGAVILKEGTRLQAQHLGLASSVGVAEVCLVRRPKVALFFTGDELVMPGEPLKPGSIYNSNRTMLCAMLENMGCELTDYQNVPDDLLTTQKVLHESAKEHDLIITSGGVSVGEEDHIKPGVEAQGRLNLWQIAIKPGKPLAYGEITRETNAKASLANMTSFIGLPGNPVSSFITFLLFVRPFILRMQGVEDVMPKFTPMRADFAIGKAEVRNEFLRARINDQGGLDLFKNQGSGVLTSTVWGDGLIDNPPNHLIEKGSMVQFISFNELLYS